MCDIEDQVYGKLFVYRLVGFHCVDKCKPVQKQVLLATFRACTVKQAIGYKKDFLGMNTIGQHEFVWKAHTYL